MSMHRCSTIEDRVSGAKFPTLSYKGQPDVIQQPDSSLMSFGANASDPESDNGCKDSHIGIVYGNVHCWTTWVRTGVRSLTILYCKKFYF